MSEVKRDAAADLAMCEAAYPGPWSPINSNGDFVLLAKRVVAAGDECDIKFIAESRTALPHWIKRAQEAEKRISEACDKLNSLITLISMAGGAGESVDIWGISSELCAIASELESE
jgi:hypothetical protein